MKLAGISLTLHKSEVHSFGVICSSGACGSLEGAPLQGRNWERILLLKSLLRNSTLVANLQFHLKLR